MNDGATDLVEISVKIVVFICLFVRRKYKTISKQKKLQNVSVRLTRGRVPKLDCTVGMATDTHIHTHPHITFNINVIYWPDDLLRQQYLTSLQTGPQTTQVHAVL